MLAVDILQPGTIGLYEVDVWIKQTLLLGSF